jgi:transposase-like protein
VSERATPFYCPYCGDEDIRPAGEQLSTYRCDACLRTWELKFVGTNRRPASAAQNSEETR